MIAHVTKSALPAAFSHAEPRHITRTDEARSRCHGGEIPWGDSPPFRAPVFVVTHRPRETLQRDGGTSFTCVSGIEQAVAMAREAAGGKDVVVAGGGSLL